MLTVLGSKKKSTGSPELSVPGPPLGSRMYNPMELGRNSMGTMMASVRKNASTLLFTILSYLHLICSEVLFRKDDVVHVAIWLPVSIIVFRRCSPEILSVDPANRSGRSFHSIIIFLLYHPSILSPGSSSGLPDALMGHSVSGSSCSVHRYVIPRTFTLDGTP